MGRSGLAFDGQGIGARLIRAQRPGSDDEPAVFRRGPVQLGVGVRKTVVIRGQAGEVLAILAQVDEGVEGVGDQGDPQFLLVEHGSGSEAVDEEAIRFGQSLRFTPSETPSDIPISWGSLKILWQADQ